MNISYLNIDKFKQWLVKSGAEMQLTTNHYEVIRFKSSSGVGIVYTNKNGRCNLQGAAVEAYSFFDRKQNWIASKSYEAWERPEVLESLIQRDGKACFYCGKAMKATDMTIEHILSQKSGGNNNLDNLAVAHKLCNAEAGSLPIVEKVKFLLNKRKAA
jgi:hypothetical protein